MFQEEIFEILKVIEAIAGGPDSDLESYINFVNSQVVFRAIVTVRCKSRFVRECKKSLRTFGSDRIHLGHSGILGNETVDDVARLGSLSKSDLLVSPKTRYLPFQCMGRRGRARGLGKRVGLFYF